MPALAACIEIPRSAVTFDTLLWAQALVTLKNGGAFFVLRGCIATGKEANVYHAEGEHNVDLAIKIYKTSILAFKDRRR